MQKSAIHLDTAKLVTTLAVRSLFGQSLFEQSLSGQSLFGQSDNRIYLFAFFCPRPGQGLQFCLIDFDLAGFFQVLAEGFEVQAESLVLLFLR